ncbi:ABC transporter ATP-binding protein [Microbacterium sp. CPCC 204701]|uniref:ABC transporter ATP-binding protein n=1 Tax=Microbacterium sp. CPCC 204701 TaxID=2493084 RepID=UPI001F0C998C|nr:ABC transporter ATP-binding protein [Microbacterium sp. CPCC 204701]
MASPAPRLVATGLTKRFGSFVANDSIDLTLEPGRVHVVLGENGAGKSTLMNMLYGHLQPDVGTISLDGTPVDINSPSAALHHGIGMVHQHFSLVGSYSVAQNVILGVEPRGALLHPRDISTSVANTVARLGWDFDVDKKVEDLPVSAQQRVEILKLLHRGARILLLDEPTALLSPTEIDSLLDIIEKLKADGAAILLVTHKLPEVERVADTISVIRHGKVTARYEDTNIAPAEMARAMTGRVDIPQIVSKPRTPGAPVLELRGVTVSGVHGHDVISDVDLTIHEGEIVGIAAVEGNGQHELVQAILGTAKIRAGRIALAGHDITGRSPRHVRASGVAVIPADRRAEGTVSPMSLVDNYALTTVAAGGFRRGPFLDRRAMTAAATSAIDRYDIRPGRPAAAASSLSGGNMQKLVIAREIDAEPQCLIAVSPTWGLDIGAVADVQRRLVEVRNAGQAVLLSSPDLDELLALSDRIVVLYRGQVVAEFTRDTLEVDELSLALMGSTSSRKAS